ncbi:protein yippee-like At4g27740 [Euphorbia lathyris]|uniref:protein yippee-like At4g27740 n=1 Tax=Euphorbia lathyris TaxID=212925 RepID=UPI0033134B22
MAPSPSPDDYPLYSCLNCRNPIAFQSDLISKGYKAKSGQAYMFSHVMSVVLGRKEERQLITGKYSIASIYCSSCGEELGWKYIYAFDPKQRYKEGHFVVEKLKLFEE